MGPTTNDGCGGVPLGNEGATPSTGGGGAAAGEMMLKKGPWTAAEDAILVEYVRKHGEGNWNAVQKHSGLSRCGKSCRLRWANHLRPNLRKGAFSPQEERLIVEMHAKFGNKWARMASLLPGRTDNEIKNYWNTRVKRHQRQGIPLYPPDLQPHIDSTQHHHLRRSHSAPTTPNSSSFQTAPHQVMHSPLTPTPAPLTPTTPPSLSPLSSSSSTTTTTSTGATTLPLFDFYQHRPPPLLQTPLRFKRFSSNDLSTYAGTNISPQYSMPLSLPPLAPFAASNASPPVNHQLAPCYFTSTPSSTSNIDFHKELQRENQKMCSLFAAMTNQSSVQPSELPSDPLLFTNSSSQNWDSGFGFESSEFGKAGNKRNLADIGGLGPEDSGSGLLEDLLQESKFLKVSSDEQNYVASQEQRPRTLAFDGSWDPSQDLMLSPVEPKENVEAVGQLNPAPEDFTKPTNNHQSSTQAVLYIDNGDISHGPSSVITDDTFDLDMQQIASMFPITTEHDKAIGSCSWDNLPRMF